MFLAEYVGMPGHFAVDLSKVDPPRGWLDRPTPLLTPYREQAACFDTESEAREHGKVAFGGEYTAVAA